MPLGVFDSGVGGLTVVRALRASFPRRDILYVGDTARVPYGNKSAETVTSYIRVIIAFLKANGADRIVVACNTASALAVKKLRLSAGVPLHGMIESGVEAAPAVGGDGPVGGDWNGGDRGQRGLSGGAERGTARLENCGPGNPSTSATGGGGVVGGGGDRKGCSPLPRADDEGENSGACSCVYSLSAVEGGFRKSAGERGEVGGLIGGVRQVARGHGGKSFGKG